ncbi:MAG: SRPBCC domain-containing protein [Actinobacteria bacterium]|nr:SRPBCC domain-containing protein [Actinomycetota bacterium]
MTDVVVTRLIAASPATVFSFFTDAERWTSWQGVDGEVDARPGGVFRIRMPGAQVASGRFVEVVPEQRLVFTWGWEGEAPPVPPGSTTVVIELEPDEAGTLLRLTHSALAPPPVAELHRQGWERYLERLRVRAEGGDPGPDSPEMEPGRTARR